VRNDGNCRAAQAVTWHTCANSASRTHSEERHPGSGRLVTTCSGKRRGTLSWHPSDATTPSTLSHRVNPRPSWAHGDNWTKDSFTASAHASASSWRVSTCTFMGTRGFLRRCTSRLGHPRPRHLSASHQPPAGHMLTRHMLLRLATLDYTIDDRWERAEYQTLPNRGRRQCYLHRLAETCTRMASILGSFRCHTCGNAHPAIWFQCNTTWSPAPWLCLDCMAKRQWSLNLHRWAEQGCPRSTVVHEDPPTRWKRFIEWKINGPYIRGPFGGVDSADTTLDTV
jgi:hypothetical protein